MRIQHDSAVYDVLHSMVSALVDNPNELKLELVVATEGVNFRIEAPNESGKLIGKQGRTARSLRTLLEVMGNRGGRVYTLDIVESPQMPVPAPIIPVAA